MEHPEDCAVQITYEAALTQMFRFDRLPSLGKFYDEICLDENDGGLTVKLPKGSKAQRFTICFVLPDDYSSGGLAGIKLWPEHGEKPDEPQDWTGPIPGTPFHLRVHYEGDTLKIRKLSLIDNVAASGHFRYKIGLVTDNGFIEMPEDPRIRNTGPIPAGKR